MMIRRNRKAVGEGITPEIIMSCVREHQGGLARWDRLDRYYRGEHDILNREPAGEFAPNNRIVCNFPKYICDTAIGYMFGNDIMYKSPEDMPVTELTELFSRAEINTHDAELGKDLSVFGEGFELAYMSADDVPVPKMAVIDPRNAFVVYDDTVEERPLFAVEYHRTAGEAYGAAGGYAVTVYDEDFVYSYAAESLNGELVKTDEDRPNFFAGMLPVTQYWNNEEGMGDFESVTALIDAYNVLQSDRINDKERFVNAILKITGGQFETGEDGELTSAAKALLDNGILQLPEGADAEYLVKIMNEGEIETLKKAIISDIHKFSQIPDFSDESFAGNKSGVALAYKLLSLEYLSKVKERFFISGLRARLRLFAKYIDIMAGPPVDTGAIQIMFNRSLPTNGLETAQIVEILSGKVSLETLLSQLTFVKDIPAELERLRMEATV